MISKFPSGNLLVLNGQTALFSSLANFFVKLLSSHQGTVKARVNLLAIYHGITFSDWLQCMLLTIYSVADSG